MASTFVKPSQTLYVRQVHGKASKSELKRSLYHLFSQHGAVIDVVLMKTLKMRSQAFVVFRDVAGATASMRALQGFPFYEQALKIEYAKSKSNAVALLEGKVTPPPRKTDKEKEDSSLSQKRMREGDGDDADEEEGGDEKKRKTIQGSSNVDDEDEDMDMEDSGDEEATNPASKILFLTALPAQITTGGPDTLITLFKDYPGFKEVRLVPGKSDLAFVEYGNVQQAAEAKKKLDGFSIVPGKTMKIQFAKV
ncbi:hypothetical protein BC830DRAFT_1095667 [Chytriomyces sp. MP71]|nr:hypothetical protein BC830DRAFT_1095667 [Chytriomyces sp. MP71]